MSKLVTLGRVTRETKGQQLDNSGTRDNGDTRNFKCFVGGGFVEGYYPVQSGEFVIGDPLCVEI